MERDEMINECKRIIAEWGSVNSGERELDCSPCIRSVGNGKQNVSDLVESFNADGVEVVVYNDEIEISSYDLMYEELDDDILFEVWEILDIYDVDMYKTMGYHTRFELQVKHDKGMEIIADLRATNEEAEYALTENGQTNEEAKWYDREKDIKEFSEKYPDALFTMWGEGEDAGGDYWKLYVQNGLSWMAIGEIVYPSFDPEKLK